MTLSLIRGAFLNPFELQNFYPLRDKYNIRAISSQYPISTDIDIPLTKLWSPTDLPSFPYKYPILNRVFTDAHYLLGLEDAICGNEIVHVAETYYHYTIQAIKEKQRGNIGKIVSTVWEVIPHNNEGIRGRKEFKHLSYKHVDHFIAVTKLAQSALIDEGVGPDKISVIPMGVDLSRFCPTVIKKKNNKVNILFIGRLVPEKGIAELVTAFNSLHQKNHDISLTVIGSGPLYSKIAGIEGINIKSISYQDIHREYQNADIFCLPSQATRHWQEQYGMVLVEAMASGLPIITTATGAIPEVCGDCALFASISDPESLRKDLKLLITNPKLREKMGTQSRQRAERNFDRTKIAKLIGGVYEKHI